MRKETFFFTSHLISRDSAPFGTTIWIQKHKNDSPKLHTLKCQELWQLQAQKSCFSYYVILHCLSNHHRLKQLAHVSGFSGMKAISPFIKSCGNSSHQISSTKQVCFHAILTPFILSQRKSNFKLNYNGNYPGNHLLLEGSQTKKINCSGAFAAMQTNLS